MCRKPRDRVTISLHGRAVGLESVKGQLQASTCDLRPRRRRGKHLMITRLWLPAAVTSLILLGAPSAAWATFHEWRFAEVYSNASGTVQFIELADPNDGEVRLQGVTLKSNGHDFTFPANLPDGTPTAGHRLLLATPGYFDLLGVPAADYNLGVNNFFATSGDTLVYASGLDTLAFNSSQLPLDSLHALVRTTPTGGSPVTTAVNSPTDVGGTSGVLPPWENQDNRFDVSHGGGVVPLDVLQVINDLIAHNSHTLAPPDGTAAPPPYLDVNGSNSVTPLDALQVINFLIAKSNGGGGLADLGISMAASDPEPLAMTLSLTATVPEPGTASLALCAAGLFAAGWSLARIRRG